MQVINMLSNDFLITNKYAMKNLIKNFFSREKTDFASLIREGAVIIDVRTAGEFKDGHIPGSRNIPLDSIQNKMEEIRKLHKPVITVCRSGMRSKMARSILASGGLTVFNGGAWDVLETRIK